MATMDECFDVSVAAGGSPATFYPDTVAREWFEQWVAGHAPTAEFERNQNGEYIVLGMHGEYLAFVAGWATRDFADRAKNKPAGDAVPNVELSGPEEALSPEGRARLPGSAAAATKRRSTSTDFLKG